MDEKPLQQTENQPAPTPPAQPITDEASSKPLPLLGIFLLLNGLSWADLIVVTVTSSGAIASVSKFLGFALVPLGVASGILLMAKGPSFLLQIIGGLAALILTTFGFLLL